MSRLRQLRNLFRWGAGLSADVDLAITTLLGSSVGAFEEAGTVVSREKNPGAPIRVARLPDDVCARIDHIFTIVASHGTGVLIARATEDAVDFYAIASTPNLTDRQRAVLRASAGIILDWRIDEFDRTIWTLNPQTFATDDQIENYAFDSGRIAMGINRQAGTVTVEVPDAG